MTSNSCTRRFVRTASHSQPKADDKKLFCYQIPSQSGLRGDCVVI
jgi:hypothetical protein